MGRKTLKRNLFRFEKEYLKFRKAYSDIVFPFSSPNYSQGSNIKTAPQAKLGKAAAKFFILAKTSICKRIIDQQRLLPLAPADPNWP